MRCALSIRSRASARYAIGSLFLCLCKETSNQKESTPRGGGLRPSMAANFARGTPGFVDGTSLYQRQTRAHPWARPFGLFLRTPRRLLGAPLEASASCAPRATAKAESRAERTALSLDGAHDARAFDLPGAPMRRRADVGQAAAGGRPHGWGRVCRQYMDVLSTNLRSLLAHPGRRMRSGRRIGGEPGVCRDALKRISTPVSARQGCRAGVLLQGRMLDSNFLTARVAQAKKK